MIQISGGSSESGVNMVESHFKPDLLHEFDPSIIFDNLKEGTSGGGVGGRRSSAMPPETYAHRQPCSVTVKLAAKMVSVSQLLIMPLMIFIYVLGRKKKSSQTNLSQRCCGLNLTIANSL